MSAADKRRGHAENAPGEAAGSSVWMVNSDHPGTEEMPSEGQGHEGRGYTQGERQQPGAVPGEAPGQEAAAEQRPPRERGAACAETISARPSQRGARDHSVFCP